MALSGLLPVGVNAYGSPLAISLSQSWNMMSAPSNTTINISDIKVIYNGTTYNWSYAVSHNLVLGFVYNWDASSQMYGIVSTLTPSQGDWMYAYNDCSILISSSVSSDRWLGDLKLQWNMIGIPYDYQLNKQTLGVLYNGTEYSWNQATTTQNPTGSPIILKFVYGWHRNGQYYELVNSLIPGYGYWMYAYQNCTLLKPIVSPHAPTITLITPNNGSTGVGLRPICKVWVNDSQPSQQTVMFYYSTDGINYSVAKKSITGANSTATRLSWNYTPATDFSTMYYWKVTADDGTTNATSWFYFTTKAAAFPPTAFVIYPKSGSTDINLQPACSVWANDTNGEQLTVNFYQQTLNYSFIRRQTNITSANTTVQWNFSQATDYATTYTWLVTISDGTDNISQLSNFTTKNGPPSHIPTCVLIFPGNGSTNNNLQPICSINANDSQGGTLTINFYDHSTGVYVRRQTNVSAANETFTWNYSQADAYSTTYYWRVTVNDGTTNISSAYYFSTKAASHIPAIYVIYPKNQSLNIFRRPTCKIWANDTNSDILTINFYSSNDGINYTHRLKNTTTSGLSHQIQWNYTQANSWITTYYWKVTVYDGITNVTNILWFTTKDLIGPHVPTIYLITPKDNSTGNNLQPKCRIWANDSYSGPLYVNFYYWNYTAYVHQQKNITTDLTTIVLWNATVATEYGWTYTWKVTVDDGQTNTSKIYRFILKNTPNVPSIYLITPKNQSTNVSLQPKCRIWENNTHNVSQTINFYENSTGGWAHRQKNVTISNNTVTWNYTQAISWSTAYYWKVTVNDGTTNVSKIFHFGTKQMPSPTIYVIYPKNQSLGIGKRPLCSIWANDSADLVTVFFYSSTNDINYTLRQTSYVDSNSIVQWNYSSATGFSTKYYWKVIVDDGTSQAKGKYYFTTRSDYHPPTIYVIDPKNQSTGISVRPFCQLWTNKTDTGIMSIDIYNSYDGITYTWRQNYITRNDNYSILWNYSYATNYSAKYYWKVNIDDGISNTSGKYYFRTKTIPTIYLVYPKNQSTNMTRQPKCRIKANESQGAQLVVDFYSSYNGVDYTHRLRNASVFANSTVQWNYSQANAYNTRYYWMVTVNNGEVNATKEYYFNTKPTPNHIPAIYVVRPKDGSTGINSEPTCNLWVNDTNSDALIIDFYNSTDGINFIHQQQNMTTGDSISEYVQWNYTQASTFDTKYYWKITAFDGVTNVTGNYSFTVKGTPTVYVMFPKNGSQNLSQGPLCAFWANDTQGGVTINIYSSMNGINFTHEQTNIAIETVNLIQWNYTTATEWWTTYYWEVTADDGIVNATYVYHFSTMHDPNP
jgi:hypothetical protein